MRRLILLLVGITCLTSAQTEDLQKKYLPKALAKMEAMGVDDYCATMFVGAESDFWNREPMSASFFRQSFIKPLEKGHKQHLGFHVMSCFAAQKKYEALIEGCENRQLKALARYRIAWCGRILPTADNRQLLNEIINDDKLDAKLRDRAQQLLDMPFKRPTVANGVSFLLPGAGQLYTGYPVQGVLRLAVAGVAYYFAISEWEAMGDGGKLWSVMGMLWLHGNSGGDAYLKAVCFNEREEWKYREEHGDVLDD